MRVGEAGQHAPSAQVDDLGARQRALVGAHPACDAVAGDRERARQSGAPESIVRTTPFSRNMGGDCTDEGEDEDARRTSP